MTKIELPGLPAPLESEFPDRWVISGGGIIGRAEAGTDLFTSPFGGERVDSASMLLFPVEGDFLLSAEVTVEFASTFDAGVLVMWQDVEHWAKLCYEYSPQGNAMVVSVVNRETSDDCNSVVVGSGRVRLRIGRRGAGCVFHYSDDGAYWHLVRAFRLAEKPLKAGFLVQSPKGAGCRARFGDVRYQPVALRDIRSGE